jgi:hypothetical protein
LELLAVQISELCRELTVCREDAVRFSTSSPTTAADKRERGCGSAASVHLAVADAVEQSQDPPECGLYLLRLPLLVAAVTTSMGMHWYICNPFLRARIRHALIGTGRLVLRQQAEVDQLRAKHERLPAATQRDLSREAVGFVYADSDPITDDHGDDVGR